MTDFKHILVPTDFSDAAGRALRIAADLSKRYGAALTLLHVWEIPIQYAPEAPLPEEYLKDIQSAAQRSLDQALTELRKDVPAAQSILRMGWPWEQILAVASETRADLIVMGTHGRRGFAHAFLGSVAEKTVRTSPVPVLTVGAATRKT